MLDFFRQADLLIGVGFEPVESDKLWHQSMTLVSIGPATIAEDAYRPHAEVVGNLAESLTRVRAGVTRESIGLVTRFRHSARGSMPG